MNVQCMQTDTDWRGKRNENVHKWGFRTGGGRCANFILSIAQVKIT